MPLLLVGHLRIALHTFVIPHGFKHFDIGFGKGIIVEFAESHPAQFIG